MGGLATAIQNAVTEIDKTEKNDGTGTKEDVKPNDRQPSKSDDKTDDEVPEDQEEGKKETEGDLSEEDLFNARQLYKAFKDPQQSAFLVDYLAKQAGYQAPETKKEAKEQAKDLVEQLKESVGPDLEFIVDKIGPTIKNYLTEQVDAVRSELAQSEAKRENEKLVDQTRNAITDLAKKYYNQEEFPKDVYAEMNKLMDKIQPSANMNPSEYIEMLYFTVAGKKGINIKSTQKVDRNRSDVPSRIEGQRGAKAQAVREAPKKLTLNESIRTAMEQLDKGEG